MYKNHIKCLYLGSHPFEDIVRAYMIRRGYVFVETETDADIVILGGNSVVRPVVREVPCLVLSSHEMFKGTRLQYPVNEEEMAAVHPYADFAQNALRYLLTEQETLERSPNSTLVVRTFPIYGEGTPENVVSSLLKKAANNEPLERLNYGHRVRSFLHVDDFCEGLDRLIHRCLKGSAGIYNLGSTYQTSIQQLAQSIWQLNGLNHKTTIDEDWEQLPWRPTMLVPEMTRTFALIQWKPSVALRMGLSNLVGTEVSAESRSLVL